MQNLVMMFYLRKLVTSYSFTSFKGTNFVHCVKYFIEVRMYECYFDECGNIFPINPMVVDICSKVGWILSHTLESKGNFFREGLGITQSTHRAFTKEIF